MILEISFHARTSRLILVELGPSILCSGKQFCPCMGLFFTSSYLLYVDKIIRWRNRSERSPCMRKVGCSNPSRDRPKSLTKRPVGHIAHLRKQFKSINITLIKRRKNNIKSPSPKDALCQVWLKLAQWFWRRR